MRFEDHSSAQNTVRVQFHWYTHNRQHNGVNIFLNLNSHLERSIFQIFWEDDCYLKLLFFGVRNLRSSPDLVLTKDFELKIDLHIDYTGH